MTDDKLKVSLTATLKKFAAGTQADERERVALRLEYEADKLDRKRPDPGETTNYSAMADGLRVAAQIARNPDLTIE